MRTGRGWAARSPGSSRRCSTANCATPPRLRSSGAAASGSPRSPWPPRSPGASSGAEAIEQGLAAVDARLAADLKAELDVLRESAAELLGLDLTVPEPEGRLARAGGSSTPPPRMSARPSCWPVPSAAGFPASSAPASGITCVVKPPAWSDSQIGRARGDLQYRLAEATRALARAVEQRYADGTGRIQSALRAAAELREASQPRRRRRKENWPNGKRRFVTSWACSTRLRRQAASVPSAVPMPRGPTVLTLYSAADLLTGPGCPVCRYAAEAGDRYLAWFALEAHADAVTITRLCSSLGMCPRHTRGLMSQPGAPSRLTAVYRYVLQTARDRLSGHAARLAICPACEHDDGAAGRALDTLLEGLTDNQVRDRYRELGGLCIPHLRTASARGNCRVAAWLSQTMTAAVSACRASPDWLAGIDHDARCAPCCGARPRPSHLPDLARASPASPWAGQRMIAWLRFSAPATATSSTASWCCAAVISTTSSPWPASGTPGRCWPGRLAALPRA